MVSLELQQDTNHRNGTSTPLRRAARPRARTVIGGSSGGPVQFAVSRDAGRSGSAGILINGAGAGTYTFSPNPDYISAMAQAGYRGLEDDAVMRLAFWMSGRAFVASIQAAGHRNVPLEDPIRMRGFTEWMPNTIRRCASLATTS